MPLTSPSPNTHPLQTLSDDEQIRVLLPWIGLSFANFSVTFRNSRTEEEMRPKGLKKQPWNWAFWGFYSPPFPFYNDFPQRHCLVPWHTFQCVTEIFRAGSILPNTFRERNWGPGRLNELMAIAKWTLRISSLEPSLSVPFAAFQRAGQSQQGGKQGFPSSL